MEELRNGQTVRDREVTLRARSGKSLSLLVSMERIEIDGEPCLLAISKDIGERKRAEAKLRAVEARSRSLIQNSTDVFSIVDQDGTYLYVSPSVQTVYGVDPDSVIGLRLADAVHRDDLPSAMNDLQTVLDDPERMVVSTVRMMTAGRSWRWIETTSTNLLDDPHIRGIVCSSRDVTDRKLAEQALERSEGRFRSLVQNASDIITVMDQNAVVLYVSPSVTAILGYPPAELIGQNALPYLPESEYADIQRLLEALIAAGRGAIARPTFHFRTVGGDYRCLEALATNLLDDPSVGGIVINSRDITERVLAEEALRLSQERLLSAEKLAGLGRLTAGLAHEINTPLAAAMNGLHLARGLAEEYRESIGQPGVNEQDHREIASELIARLDEVDATTARIGEFIRQMRGHTRDTVSGTTEFDPARLAADTLSMLAHEARAASVELHLEAPRGRLALRGEPGRFTQVLTNLVVNAVHACETVGHARRVDVRFLDLEGQLCLQVEDNGAGIPADVLPRIFEPMFTTKEVGKGTGLGLSIIYDIVQGHFGGEIEVETELGRGTVFSVRFPAMTLA